LPKRFFAKTFFCQNVLNVSIAKPSAEPFARSAFQEEFDADIFAVNEVSAASALPN
jgi:hypothetical protein